MNRSYDEILDELLIELDCEYCRTDDIKFYKIATHHIEQLREVLNSYPRTNMKEDNNE